MIFVAMEKGDNMESAILSLLITLMFVFLICFILAKRQQTKKEEVENVVLFSENHIMDVEKYCNRYSVCASIEEAELKFEQEAKE